MMSCKTSAEDGGEEYVGIYCMHYRRLPIIVVFFLYMYLRSKTRIKRLLLEIWNIRVWNLISILKISYLIFDLSGHTFGDMTEPA